MENLNKPGVSGRKLVLGCAAFVTLLAFGGVYWMITETARQQERRQTLFKQTGIAKLEVEFLQGASPIRVSPPTQADNPIAYWEVYSIDRPFQEVVSVAKEELDRIDPSISDSAVTDWTWQHNGKKAQVIIVKDTAFPEFNGQGNREVFPDLPPLVSRTGSVVVRIDYKRN